LKFRLLFLFLPVLVLSSITSPAFADSVPIQNASFETTSSLIACGAGCFYNLGPIPDWTTTGVAGSWQPTSAYSVPDGSFIAYSNGGTISQTLAATVLPDATYTLSVDIGHRPDGLANNYMIALFAGNTLLGSESGSNGTIPLGTFMDESFSYTSGALPPSGNLDIVLTSDGPQIDFDNVQLNVAPVPEPGSLSLLAVGLGLAFFVLRRR
jgi:hypothetical protein